MRRSGPAARLVALLSIALALSIGCDSEAPTPPGAVIVDQLSLTEPNGAFLDEARELLERAGYAVDYVPGEDVTVEYYRALATRGYDIVLVRAHAAAYGESGNEAVDASLFTSEPFREERHTDEWQSELLTAVAYSAGAAEADELLFGIPPVFVEQRMRGDFDGATVVLMGCDLLHTPAMAEAFLERGAAGVVGWDKPVTAGHTDVATVALLRALLDEGLEPKNAAARAMMQVDADPVTGAVLLAYP